MRSYVEVDGKIVGHFNLLEESLGDFLKRKNISSSSVLNKDVITLHLKSTKDKKQLELKLKTE